MTGHTDPDRRRIDGHLVVGGVSHDFDAVRLDLLMLAADDDRLRLRVSASFEEFADGHGVADPAFLVSYSCNVAPSDHALVRLRAFLEAGGRWLALHATNSLIEWRPDGVFCQPLSHPFLALMGSSFQAHPPIGRFTVRPVSNDPLVAGIAPFVVEDELYLADIALPVEVLLAADFSGHAPGFVRSDWTAGDPVRPMLYRRQVGAGAILNLALGHRRGVFDAPHRAAILPARDEGAWARPEFRTILARALRWAARTDPELEHAA